MTGITITDLLPGKYAAVFLAEGSGIALSNEAMEEVSDIENEIGRASCRERV